MSLGTSFARSMNLRLILPPSDVPHVVVRQHWHRRFHHDPQNRRLLGPVHSLTNDSLVASQSRLPHTGGSIFHVAISQLQCAVRWAPRRDHCTRRTTPSVRYGGTR